MHHVLETRTLRLGLAVGTQCLSASLHSSCWFLLCHGRSKVQQVLPVEIGRWPTVGVLHVHHAWIGEHVGKLFLDFGNHAHLPEERLM